VQSVKEILDFAIDREQQAVDFYKKLSAMTPGKQLKKLMHTQKIWAFLLFIMLLSLAACTPVE
jgi:hypothetical protein